ncbi:serine/threonine-protein kinase [Streptomyces sp. NPDC001339]|uniref:serine/threonine-protein kinase n=1 Tax=Streptomyces sp. NPDC001339 TaxID=3364563 RepID=UPI0036BAC0AE
MKPLGPWDPQWIGGYRLLGRLGEGGMGRVFLARSDRGRTVAVKLVRPELADEEEFRARFRREVRAAQQVGGEWTAPVLDADTEAETPWLATGYIAGPSLQQVVGGNIGSSGGTPLPERTVRILAAGLARALRSIHAAGIIHRDLKPSNVLITIDGPRVIDFGIARALEGVTGAGVTDTSAAVGSPGFMAPEQVRGEPLTPACDVFSLGSVLTYAATGRQPFGTADSAAHALMYRVAQEEPDLSALPEGLYDLVSRCLAKDPRQRPTPDELVALAEGGDGRWAGDGAAGAGTAGTGTAGTGTAGTGTAGAGTAGAEAAGADGEPWLPGALIARLGRHAVELLEAEQPAGLPPGQPAGKPGLHALHAPPTAVSPTSPTPAPTHRPSAAQAAAAGAPRAPRSRRRRAGTTLLTVVALALAGAGAVTAYTLLTDSGSGVRTAEDGGAGGQASAQPAADGGIPAGYLGTWETTVGDDGTDVRRLTLTQGKSGDTVLTMTATGSTYRCEFAASLKSAGPPVRLGPSTVLSGPPDTCRSGESSILELIGGTLRRTTDGGSALSYRRADDGPSG